MASINGAALRGMLLSLCAVSASCGGPAAGPAVNAPAPRTASAPITRTLLEHYDLPQMPGWESRLYLVEYGPGVVSPLHHHPVRGLGYVLSGSFESAFGNEQPSLVRAGQSFIEREDEPHRLFRNPDPTTPLKFVITFVVRTGAPVLETP